VIVRSVSAHLHGLPLLEPFRIATSVRSHTRAVLVRAICEEGAESAEGLGECALPMRAREEPEDLLSLLEGATNQLTGREISSPEAITATVDECLPRDATPAARAGLHCALLDGYARVRNVPVHALMGSRDPLSALETDITLPIETPEKIAELARRHFAAGFRIFKLKVGSDPIADQHALAQIAAVTPSVVVRFDANEGYGSEESLALLRSAESLALRVDAFEQPCRRDDLEGLRRVRETGGVPVIADESAQSIADVDRLATVGAVDAVNLKIIKSGGLDRCLAIGRAARERGLRLMIGSMLESRVGLTAAAHLAAALGDIEWVDLDVAFLLAQDPAEGGMSTEGARLSLPLGPGLDVRVGRNLTRAP
jgi:L-alanine-DL-glutamate epimerase-like enolase superfamily enzyme